MFKHKYKNGAAVVALVLLLTMCSQLTAVAAVEETVAEGKLKVDAKSAILIDADTGKILYEQNSHAKLPPASVTKVMTMLLSMEAIEAGQITIGDRVTISERAASMGGSQMYMETGEVQTVENLLKGMAICSANDASHKPMKGNVEIRMEIRGSRQGLPGAILLYYNKAVFAFQVNKI